MVKSWTVPVKRLEQREEKKHNSDHIERKHTTKEKKIESTVEVIIFSWTFVFCHKLFRFGVGKCTSKALFVVETELNTHHFFLNEKLKLHLFKKKKKQLFSFFSFVWLMNIEERKFIKEVIQKPNIQFHKQTFHKTYKHS